MDISIIVEDRFENLMSFMDDLPSTTNLFNINIINELICEERGANNNPNYSLHSLKLLSSQNHLTKIDTDSLDMIGALINMQAFVENQVPHIFVLDFSSYHISRKRHLTERSNMRRTINAFRFRCSKISMLPFLFEGTFMVAVLITETSIAYVLTCARRNHTVASIKVL